MPDFQKVLKYVEYDPDTGHFRWKTDRTTWVKAGTIAGSIMTCRTGKRYVRIRVLRTHCLAHTLAFVVMTGKPPKHQVDHLNGDGCDNRWCNLRDVPQGENCKNTRRHRNNTSGTMGVIFDKGRQKWRATIKVNWKPIHLGYFVNKEDAVSKRKSAEVEYGFHKNHGQDRPL